MHCRSLLTLVFLLAITGCNEPEAKQPVADDPMPVIQVEDAPRADAPDANESDEDRAESTNDHGGFFGPGSREMTFDEFTEFIQSLEDDMEPPPPPEPFDPPLSAKEISDALQECLERLLTDPDDQDTREFYGTAGETEVMLVDHDTLKWPDGFKPSVDGYQLRVAEADSIPTDGNRILGVRLDRMDVTSPVGGFRDGNIVLTLTSVGGDDNGMVTGGCRNYFKLQRRDGVCEVQSAGSFDP